MIAADVVIRCDRTTVLDLGLELIPRYAAPRAAAPAELPPAACAETGRQAGKPVASSFVERRGHPSCRSQVRPTNPIHVTRGDVR
jgi:hypothetical protein